MRKKILVLLSILTISVVIVFGSRIINKSSLSSTSYSSAKTKSHPKGWPWKGISMQSGKSDYKDIQY